MKNRSIILLFALSLVFWSCNVDRDPWESIAGETMGTYYKITCLGPIDSLQKEVDSLLKNLNNDLSTYEERSVISNFNKFDVPYTLNSRKDLDGTFCVYLIFPRAMPPKPVVILILQ